jgi:hypothetical protein
MVKETFFDGSTLFIGKETDEPDLSTTYKIRGNGYIGFTKINNDKCDDIYYYGNLDVSDKPIAHFVFGNSSQTPFQTFTVISPHAMKTTDMTVLELPKAIYRNKQGQWRLLTHSKGWIRGTYTTIWQPKITILRLYSLEFKQVTEDSTTVILNQIDEYKDPKWSEYEDELHTKTPLNWLPVNDAGLLYNSEHYPKILYYASMNTMPDKETKKYDSYATYFDLTNDKIVPSNTVVNVAAPECKILKHSIDGDDKHQQLFIQLADAKVHFYTIHESGILTETFTINTNNFLNNGFLTTLFSIEDITGDSIPDVACLFKNNATGNALIIAKGQNITTSIKEAPQQSFSISSPYPLPNSSRLTIPLHCAKNGFYTLTLFSVQGSAYPLFVNKEMNEGKTDFMMDISPYSSGNYILRFSDGKTSVEKNIIITH